jgi:hypothetical protein
MTTPASRVPALALILSLVGITACDKEKASDEAKSEDKKSDGDKADGDAKAGDAKAGDKADGDKADGDKPDGDKADGDKADGDKPDGDKPPTPAGSTASVAGGDGVAYFAVNSRGIAKLDASGWSMLVDNSRGSYTRMFIGADENVYVLDYEAIKKVEGNKLVDVAKFDYKTFTGATDAALGSDGKFYAAGYKGLGVYEGGSWKVTEATAIEKDLTGLNGLAITGDNTVWVAGSKSLLSSPAGAGPWTALDLSKLGQYAYFAKLSNSPTGDVFAVNNTQLLKLSADKYEEIELKTDSRSYASYTADLAYNDKGRVLAASHTCELASVDPKAPTEVWSVGKGAYNCQSLSVVGLDGQNRAWVVSREGLSVIAPDKTVAEYPTSTVMEIVGSSVASVVLTGAGPALPPVGPAHTGGVTGKVLLDGEAVATAKVEMCATPSYGGSQPCFESSVKFTGTTDEKGYFSFANVPIGQYNISVEIGGKWRMSYLSSLATDMKEGKEYDVGAVKFNAN